MLIIDGQLATCPSVNFSTYSICRNGKKVIFIEDSYSIYVYKYDECVAITITE